MRRGRANHQVDVTTHQNEGEEQHGSRQSDVFQEIRAEYRQYLTKLCPTKEGNELRRKKYQHNVHAHRRHRFRHRINHITIGFHRANHTAIDIAGNSKKDKDKGDDAL
ncbi:Uncharacterised protein [Vibrio cholerae]|uniref:Uncharacterized protein n=1 Tax=Vibrio cholerae TaxID=666 RepID=A0A655ZEM3_VIBCL|nr:Uncharacterised protein [Vibrio cholerae]CSB11514.1 Uncharacterised protein [Vibrio cholerae]CSB92569.1 Uncharacterised protein [Vibrio cholerae]CSC49507.1 Uncharacterised protein [Vibrio cholerae]CSC51498.1 Uncharacterised protein [Vibrio cholerae]